MAGPQHALTLRSKGQKSNPNHNPRVRPHIIIFAYLLCCAYLPWWNLDCGLWDTQADRQTNKPTDRHTNRQTYRHADYNTSHPYRWSEGFRGQIKYRYGERRILLEQLHVLHVTYLVQRTMPMGWTVRLVSWPSVYKLGRIACMHAWDSAYCYTDVAHSVVCVLGTRVSCAKVAEPIEMPLAISTQVSPIGTMYYTWIKIGRIHSQPQGVTTRRCGLLLN